MQIIPGCFSLWSYRGSRADGVLQRLPLSQGPLRKAGRTFALTSFEVCVISCRMAFAFTAPHVAPCPDFYTRACHWNVAWGAWVSSARSEGCSLQLFAGFYSAVKLSQNITDIPGWLNCSEWKYEGRQVRQTNPPVCLKYRSTGKALSK